MTATLLDGAATARAIREELRPRIEALAGAGVRPGLGVLLVGDDPASAVYVRSKTRACEELGLHHETARFAATATTAEVAGAGRGLQPARPTSTASWSSSRCRRRWTPTRCCASVDPAKDVDGFHPENVGLLVQKRPRFVACTPAGIMELLAREGIPVAGRRAVVLGRSDIVGKPMALLLLHADATVTVCHSRTRDLAAVTREADIAGGGHRPRRPRARRARQAGRGGGRRRHEPRRRPRRGRAGPPGRRRACADFERKGYALVGDVHAPSVREVAGALTPVPGGVGPLTIALLMKNTVEARRRAGARV